MVIILKNKEKAKVSMKNSDGIRGVITKMES